MISDDGRERSLTTRKSPDYFGLWGNTVAWSPDGRRIACIEAVKHNNATVAGALIVDLVDGTETRLSNQGRNWDGLFDLAWLPAGNGLLVAVREDATSPYQMWRVSYPAGEWHKVSNDLSDYEKMSVSADGKRVVALQTNDVSNLWLMPRGEAGRARQLTFGRARLDGKSGLFWTRDGRLVFASNAGGTQQIWLMNHDGSHLKQLTFGNEPSLQPFVSPDGRRMAFTCYRDNKPHICRLDLDGSHPVQLTNGSGEAWPVITPDGRTLVYTSISTPFSTTWTRPLNGDGPASQLQVGYPLSQASVSPDGKQIVAGVYDPDSEGRWGFGIFSLSGGSPLRSFDTPLVGLARWTRDGESVVYVDQHYPYLWKRPIKGGDPTKVLSLSLPERIYNFALSPDETSLVIARGRPQSDALLIEDER